jgi:putative tryptophan/tyrosine transport system substrate-binding protein
MRRREFIALIGASVAWPFVAMAQQPGRTYRLGLLVPDCRQTPPRAALFDEVKRLGFVEGRNFTRECREFGGNSELASRYAVDLVKSKVDVIYALGDTAIRAAQQATTTIPILGSTDDMVEAGLVKSLARPEGNTTGTSALSAELDGKRQEILIEAVPGLRRMAALADSNRTSGSRLQALEDAARAHNIELSVHQITRPEEIPAAIDSAKASGAAALNVLASPMLYANRRRIMDRAATLRLPSIYQSPELAEEGGFIGYGARFVQWFGEVVARQLAQLLRGTKVADIPVEQPTKFELVINLKTAKAMGVTVPEALLARADKVIE